MELHGHHDPWMVALSFVIAAAGSYAALSMAPLSSGRLAGSEARQLCGVLPSGVALGLTIWAMHFTGMAAFHIHGTPISYNWPATILSLAVAVIFTGIGFATLTLLHDEVEAVFVAGVPMASGILSMHFLGMMAMTHLNMHFEPGLVVAAAVIALVAAVAALWLTTHAITAISKIAAAVVMAAAICGMHYTGMAAAKFTALIVPPDHSEFSAAPG